jgi:hypothetical protein
VIIKKMTKRRAVNMADQEEYTSKWLRVTLRNARNPLAIELTSASPYALVVNTSPQAKFHLGKKAKEVVEYYRKRGAEVKFG